MALTASRSLLCWVSLFLLLHVSPLLSLRPDHKSEPRPKLSKKSGHKEGVLTEVEDNEDGEDSDEHSACTDLVNHGTHFTVEIEVGTPVDGTESQKFAVVADTGSDAIIVPSCACVKAGYCSNNSRCFQGTNRSSSFGIKQGKEGPPSIRMMFGSGPVQAVVASDTVRVGKLKTKMKDGLLLMTDQLLNIKGQFEGILGLGLPSADAKKSLYSQTPSAPSNATKSQAPKKTDYVGGSDIVTGYETGVQKIVPFPNADSEAEGDQTWVVNAQDLERGELQGLNPTAFLQRNATKAKKATASEKKDASQAHAKANVSAGNDTGIVVKGFMEESGIKRFSMCFNDGTNGVLRLGTPKKAEAHGSVGQVHWGLDFRGISVGKVSAPTLFCKKENMTKGQKTPCGAIPDSGTTALMAPADHLISLYESLCDEWDRCKNNFTAMQKAAKDARSAAKGAYGGVDPFHIQAAPKAVIFQHLILDCKEWLTEDKGLDELPPIHFHVAGANGTKQALQLKGWSYIIETQEKEFKYVYQNIPGLGKLPISKNFTGKTNKVCSPAFSPMEYKTAQNGPVWILGTPVFYEYQVGYDMEAKPPAISFIDEKCGSCGGKKTAEKTSFMSENVATRGRARKPRQINGPFRVPNMDLSLPL